MTVLEAVARFPFATCTKTQQNLGDSHTKAAFSAPIVRVPPFPTLRPASSPTASPFRRAPSVHTCTFSWRTPTGSKDERSSVHVLHRSWFWLDVMLIGHSYGSSPCISLHNRVSWQGCSTWSVAAPPGGQRSSPFCSELPTQNSQVCAAQHASYIRGTHGKGM